MPPSGFDYVRDWDAERVEKGWWHSFELPDGSLIEGVCNLPGLKNRLAQFPIPADLKGKRIAIPGTMTTAYLTLKLFEPDFVPVVVPFDQIIQAVKDHEVDAGLIIHEGQLTYGSGGLYCVVDLGRWFKQKYDLPLPLGANALRRNLSTEVQTECTRLMREGIQYSLEHREEALNYALQFARDLDPSLADQFVGMYVNHHTQDGGDIVPLAAQKLLDLGYEAGLIPHKTIIEVLR